jgi:DNA-binding transcriptional regulator/RsmH inhibitor MraZ
MQGGIKDAQVLLPGTAKNHADRYERLHIPQSGVAYCFLNEVMVAMGTLQKFQRICVYCGSSLGKG